MNKHFSFGGFSAIGVNGDGDEISLRIPEGETKYITINDNTRLAVSVNEYGVIEIVRQVKEYRWKNVEKNS